MPVDTAIMCVAQCWITREKKELFHRLYPTHGMLSLTLAAAIDKAIADKQAQQKPERINQDASRHAEIRSTSSQVSKVGTSKHAKGRRN